MQVYEALSEESIRSNWCSVNLSGDWRVSDFWQSIKSSCRCQHSYSICAMVKLCPPSLPWLVSFSGATSTTCNHICSLSLFFPFLSWKNSVTVAHPPEGEIAFPSVILYLPNEHWIHFYETKKKNSESCMVHLNETHHAVGSLLWLLQSHLSILSLIKMQNSLFIRMQHMAEILPRPTSFRLCIYLICSVGICPNPLILWEDTSLNIDYSYTTVMFGLIDTQLSFSAWLHIRTEERALDHISGLIWQQGHRGAPWQTE